MAIERKQGAAGPSLFTTNGGNDGKVTLSSTKKYKVKAGVIVSADTLPKLNLEVKSVLSKTEMIVGFPGKIDGGTVDLSAYSVVLNASIVQPKYDRPTIPKEDQARATYEQEPTLARRVILVDELGEFYDTDNPLKVQLLTDKESSLGANDYDITRIGNGEYELDVNPDGSINVIAGALNTPTIFNISIAIAATEYTTTIPVNTKKFYLKNRGSGKLQISFVTGGTSTNFFTLTAGAVYSEESLSLNNPLNVYFQSTKANEIVEILTWE